ncbi:uncharacterized protein LOC141651527 [Silene latifolia]|uniref:uncharacterized protein LOC141651527 n=1 Tax=Silene latifolia TaxID=37657 RepID=UPI003D76CBFD
MAAVGKLVWWIAKKKDHLWIQWVDKIYLKKRLWMDYKPTAASSWAWRKICEVKEKLKPAFTSGKWMSDDDEYSISDGYSWLEHTYPVVQWHKSVWNRFNLSKHNFNQWLIQQGRLLTLDRLVQFGITQHTVCFLCDEKPETHQHIFHECIYTEQCYMQLYLWLDLPGRFQGITDPVQMLRQRGCSGLVRLVLSSLVVALQYNIWAARNKCRVEGYVILPSVQIKNIQKESKLRLMALDKGILKQADVNWCRLRGLM